MRQNSFPNSVDDLIQALDERFPEVAPDPSADMSKVMHQAGQRSVVLYLKQWRANASKEPPIRRQRGSGRRVSR